MIKELKEKLKEASKNKNVKVIIISSIGPVFCAGHNLKDLNSKRSNTDKGKSYYKKIFRSCSDLMINIKENPNWNTFIICWWYVTSLEMNGASITLMKLDDELQPLLERETLCSMFRV